MTIYNISDTKRFFEVLTECTDRVDVYGKDGLRIEDVREQEMFEKVEIKFNNPGDAVHMVRYMASMETVA